MLALLSHSQDVTGIVQAICNRTLADVWKHGRVTILDCLCWGCRPQICYNNIYWYSNSTYHNYVLYKQSTTLVSNLCYTRVAITRMRITATATQRAPRSAGRLFQHTIEFDARTWPGPDIQVVWRRVPQT